MGYRVHRNGTIHCLDGCCWNGKGIKADNYFEVYTYEEACKQLEAKGIPYHNCQRCDWSKDKGREKK